MNLSQRYETADPTTLQNDCVGRRSDLSSLYKMSISLKRTLLGALCGAFAFGIAPAMAQPGCDPDPDVSAPNSPSLTMCYQTCEEGPHQDRLDCRDRCEDTFRSCFWWPPGRGGPSLGGEPSGRVIESCRCRRNTASSTGWMERCRYTVPGRGSVFAWGDECPVGPLQSR